MAESVYSRTFYIINDQYPDAYESENSDIQDTEYNRFFNNFYPNQDIAPKRFLKISKVKTTHNDFKKLWEKIFQYFFLKLDAI